MVRETSKKIWLGVLATSGAILFFIGIFSIGKKQNMFNTTFRVNAIFSNVNGLKEGDYVRFSGVRAGIVNSIIFLNDSMIKVEMKINRNIRHLIKKDAIAYITTEGLVGNKILEIKPKWRSDVIVKDNDTLTAIDPFDTHEIIEKLLSTNDNAKIITGNLAQISEDVNKKKSILRTVISDSIAANNLKDIISNLQKSSLQFSVLAGHLDKITDKINLDKGVAGVLLNDTATAGQVELTIKNLKETSDYATKIAGQLNESVQLHTNNAAGTLVKDTMFSRNLKQSIENLNQSTYKLNETMDALQHSIFLRGYFKKKAKEQQ
ncbi:MAG: MlaD family protein [Bacteroidia bacterium]